MESMTKKVLLILSAAVLLSPLFYNCGADACHRYFQELKRRCRLSSSAEGAKLDQYLSQQFKPCQIEICERTSIDEIDCYNPETHIPGGLNGRFEKCE